jgi:hypothetical protein
MFFWTAVSLCVGWLALWVRSGSRADTLGMRGVDWSASLNSDRGLCGVVIYYGKGPQLRRAGWNWYSVVNPDGEVAGLWALLVPRWASFGYDHGPRPGVDATWWVLHVPHWFLAALIAAFAAAAFRGWSHRRFGRGACARCGYDLRGSPAACPECGSHVPPGRSVREPVPELRGSNDKGASAA